GGVPPWNESARAARPCAAGTSPMSSPALQASPSRTSAEFHGLMKRRRDRRPDEQGGAQRDQHADTRGPAQERMAELNGAFGHSPRLGLTRLQIALTSAGGCHK